MHLDGCVPAKVIWNSAKRKNKLEELKKAAKSKSMLELWDWISVGDSCASLEGMLHMLQLDCHLFIAFWTSIKFKHFIIQFLQSSVNKRE